MMKKYNLSKIMKRAWELVKRYGLGISEALKRSWKEAKRILKGSEKQVAWATDIINNAIGTCDANIKVWEERLKEQPNFSTATKMIPIYKDIKEYLTGLFDGIDSAAKIIDMRSQVSPDRVCYIADEIYSRNNR